MAIKRICIAPGAVDSNKGDQALVATCIELARDLYPKAEIGVVGNTDSGNSQDEARHTKTLSDQILCTILQSPRRGSLQHQGAEDTLKIWMLLMFNALNDALLSFMVLLFCNISKVSKFFFNASQNKTIDFIKSSDFMFIKGGGFISAYKGLRYYYYLYFQLFNIMLANKLKVPVIIMPNSFGPFETKFSRWLTAKVLNQCRLIATRERKSDQILHEIGVRKEIIRSMPDMAFMLRPISKQNAKELLEKSGFDADEKSVGITVRPWRFPDHENPAQAWKNYIQSMARLAQHMIDSGYKPVFFPQSIGPHDHEDDRIAIHELCDILRPGSYHDVEGDWLPQELAGMYGLMDLFVGTRMHSVIFSMLSNVPVIAISYQGPKATGIMEAAKMPDLALNINSLTPEKLIDTFNFVLKNKTDIQSKIASAVEHFKSDLNIWKYEIAKSNDSLE